MGQAGKELFFLAGFPRTAIYRAARLADGTFAAPVAAGPPFLPRDGDLSFAPDGSFIAGVVSWERLTGRRLFEGETVSHTLADVLRKEIDFRALPVDTPQAIHGVLHRCLDRDVKTRLRDVGEARVAIQRHLADPAGARVSNDTTSGTRPVLTIAALGVAGIALTARSCGCDPSMRSKLDPWLEPKAPSLGRSGHRTAASSRSP